MTSERGQIGEEIAMDSQATSFMRRTRSRPAAAKWVMVGDGMVTFGMER